MAKDKLNLKYPVVVEGKYDKTRLANFIDSQIIVLGGFSSFKNKNTLQLIKNSGKNGIILLTDPDKAGTFIRGRLKTLLQDINIINVYPPVFIGSDSRRNHVCKDGVLGVESIDDDTLYELLKPYEQKTLSEATPFLTPTRCFEDGLTGKPGSTDKRVYLCKKLRLPETVSLKMLAEHINRSIKEERYKELLKSYNEEKAK